MLASHAPDEALAVSGGTDLYPNMKRRQFEPKVLVGLRALEGGRDIERHADGGLSIGGLATLQSLERSAFLQTELPALATAAGLVSSPILRHMGTLGGNLCVDTRCTYYNQTYEWRKAIDFCMKKDGAICWVAPGSPRCWAVSSSDTAPVLIALDATVTLVGPSGERRLHVKDLYRHDGIDFMTRKREEILTAIQIPALNGTRAVYRKLRRRGSIDFPILGVAAAIATAKDGTVQKARIVLTAVESAPVEAAKAEAHLVGKKLTDDVIEEASALAYRPAKPLDNTDLTYPYRKKMAKVEVARALRELRT
jgi:4-hydroxybenzoyl-CoA reductase subunit beta